MNTIKIQLLLAVLLVFVMIAGVQAKWSGGQSITWELDPSHGPVTIYTSVLDYSITENWLFTLVADKHPIYGLDMDFSTTRYFQPLSQVLYATTGVRRGVYQSQTGWTPYVTITYRF